MRRGREEETKNGREDGRNQERTRGDERGEEKIESSVRGKQRQAGHAMMNEPNDRKEKEQSKKASGREGPTRKDPPRDLCSSSSSWEGS